MQRGRFVPAVHGNMRWNHNSVYYHELVADAAERGGSALDVGCGDGELLELLAGVCERVVGVEEDPVAARAAADRVAGSGTVICGDFMAAKSLPLAGFDTITCVACLQHLPLEAALAQMAELLRPGGRLLVIGLSANKSLVDWLLSALMIVPGRVSGWIHRESTFPWHEGRLAPRVPGRDQVRCQHPAPRSTDQETPLLALFAYVDEARHLSGPRRSVAGTRP